MLKGLCQCWFSRLTLALVALLAAFTWRAYSSTIPWGWA